MKIDEIKRRLELVHGSPKRSLGQNFLISESVIDKIIEAVKAQGSSSLVEVGPGLGALTDHLLEMEKPLTVIEMDRAFIQYWQERGGLKVVAGDALKVNWSEFPKELLVSNLPYQISSSLVIEQSVSPDPFSSMVLMFQKEVAQRIQSPPRNEAYGLLSVIAQTFWEVRKVSDASPRDFYPAPKVASRVLHFKSKASPVDDPRKYLSFVKAAFNQRRKKMVRSMATFLNNSQIELEAFVALCKECGLGENTRAEELSIEQFVALYQAYRELRTNNGN